MKTRYEYGCSKTVDHAINPSLGPIAQEISIRLQRVIAAV
jgi:hypothetical protein